MGTRPFRLTRAWCRTTHDRRLPLKTPGTRTLRSRPRLLPTSASTSTEISYGPERNVLFFFDPKLDAQARAYSPRNRATYLSRKGIFNTSAETLFSSKMRGIVLSKAAPKRRAVLRTATLNETSPITIPRALSAATAPRSPSH